MKILIRFLLIIIVFAFPGVVSAETLSECEYLLPPVADVKDLTGKELAVGVADCYKEDGVDVTATIYCGKEDWEDATKCANAQNIPTLKVLMIPTLAAPSKANGKDKTEAL